MKTWLLVLLLPLQIFAQRSNLVPWSLERRLTWNDFQGSVPANAPNAALTSSTIGFNYGYSETGFTYSITCSFDKKLSWGRIKNAYILGHEQGHFDIAELYARKFNKALANYKVNHRTLKSDVNNLYMSLMQEHSRTQNQYDDETDFSRNPDEQLRWLKKIDKMLDDYKAYANYISPKKH